MSDPNDDTLRDNAPDPVDADLSAYVLGERDEIGPERVRAVEERLESDPEFRRQAELLETTAGLVRDLPLSASPDGTGEEEKLDPERRAAVVAAASAPLPARTGSPIIRTIAWLGAAAAIVVIAVLVGQLMKSKEGERVATLGQDAGKLQIEGYNLASSDHAPVPAPDGKDAATLDKVRLDKSPPVGKATFMSRRAQQPVVRRKLEEVTAEIPKGTELHNLSNAPGGDLSSVNDTIGLGGGAGGTSGVRHGTRTVPSRSAIGVGGGAAGSYGMRSKGKGSLTRAPGTDASPQPPGRGRSAYSGAPGGGGGSSAANSWVRQSGSQPQDGLELGGLVRQQGAAGGGVEWRDLMGLT